MKSASQTQTDVVDFLIVGAGATGLMLALLLHRRGFSVKVAEQRATPLAHSRSIGIHPPSLKLLDEFGLLDQFSREAVSVTSGLAVVGGGEPVALPMCSGVGTDRILVVPQQTSEMLLESALDRNIIDRGLQYVGHTEISSQVQAVFHKYEENSNEPLLITTKCRYLIAADGMYSSVRPNTGISLDKYRYPWPYCMGDFPDTTGFGDRAVIFLSQQGLTESFPLPGGLRRWVINLSSDDPILDDNRPDGVWHGLGNQKRGSGSDSSTDADKVGDSHHQMPADGPKTSANLNAVNRVEQRLGKDDGRAKGSIRPGTITPEDLTQRIYQRTRYRLKPEERLMFSVFRIYRGIVPRLWQGRVVLAGDAAHVMSPIGGQGMNVAWMNAKDLVDLIERYGPGNKAFEEYSAVCRRRFRKFANRAAFNTRVGRPGHPEWVLRLAVRLLSSRALRNITARRFTMR
jgi:2-polyprenyl-6-methoxyphenol hydroxylase-like FAD-dependent oxidoreductase